MHKQNQSLCSLLLSPSHTHMQTYTLTTGAHTPNHNPFSPKPLLFGTLAYFMLHKIWKALALRLTHIYTLNEILFKIQTRVGNSDI